MAKKRAASIVETVAIESLKPHPQNYRSHPDDQVEHIMASIREHGIYRNIVVAKDYTILAGHGVVEGAKKLGHTEVPVIKMDVSPTDPAAFKIMVGDNEISKLASVDDRALSNLLKELSERDGFDFAGTGFDKQKLAALVMVTRTAGEIEDFDAAAEWVGMPEYNSEINSWGLNVQFDSREERADFLEKLGLNESCGKQLKGGRMISMWWPLRDRDDLRSLEFVPAEA
jgi:hypothetical protein